MPRGSGGGCAAGLIGAVFDRVVEQLRSAQEADGDALASAAGQEASEQLLSIARWPGLLGAERLQHQPQLLNLLQVRRGGALRGGGIACSSAAHARMPRAPAGSGISH